MAAAVPPTARCALRHGKRWAACPAAADGVVTNTSHRECRAAYQVGVGKGAERIIDDRYIPRSPHSVCAPNSTARSAVRIVHCALRLHTCAKMQVTL